MSRPDVIVTVWSHVRTASVIQVTFSPDLPVHVPSLDWMHVLQLYSEMVTLKVTWKLKNLFYKLNVIAFMI